MRHIILWDYTYSPGNKELISILGYLHRAAVVKLGTQTFLAYILTSFGFTFSSVIAGSFGGSFSTLISQGFSS